MENGNGTENGKRKSKVINYAHAHKSLVPAHVTVTEALVNLRRSNGWLIVEGLWVPTATL